MAYRVVVSVAERDLSDQMTAMRTWLDHQKFEPDTFRYKPDALSDGMIGVEFKLEHEAMAFAQAFGGQVVGESSAVASVV